MNKTQKAAAIAVAAVMTCGIFAGCDLITTNERKNMAQVIAEVNITTSEKFDAEFGEGASQVYKEVISTSEISKRDMIVTFVGAGYSSMINYGWTYKDTFNSIAEVLYQREIYLQYAKVYFLENGWEGSAATSVERIAGYKAAIAGKTGVERDLEACKYILSDEEEAKANYGTRKMFNSSIDSQEKNIIKEKESDVEYETNVRATPTGLNTDNSDYVDNAYRIYTGTGKQAEVQGSYEKVKDSTATTRKKAYNSFLASLKTNDLVQNGEDTSDIESLSYYKLELKRDYEDALVQKLTDTFTEQAEALITYNNGEYCSNYFTQLVSEQRMKYGKSTSALESDMGSVSDTNFVLTSPSDTDVNYGFAINILLPFSTSQSNKLTGADKDFGDPKGNKFVQRAELLQAIKATDQRGSWFTGETDYSFEASSTAYGYSTDRKWLFFEDNLNDGVTEYKRLKNYYGNYTYNGTYDAEKRVYEPNKIDIDGFLSEMKGYLASAGYGMSENKASGYYTRTVSDYYKSNGDVDYSKFIYQSGKVDFNNTKTSETEAFNANEIFKKGSAANDVMSVIRELSFAYNTDTAGLNTYLGYAISANKTDFVSEFEYAAQEAVRGGAGSYVVVPSDYGWHIIYCTFSFADGTNGTPFSFNYADIKEEGTFSYLFYESIKADKATSDASARRTKIVNALLDSYTLYENRYADLTELDNK